MSIDVTIYADANARAVEAGRSLLGALGTVYLLPPRCPGVATPAMGLLAVEDEAGHCLDHQETFGEADPPAPAGWSGALHSGLPAGIWDGRGGRALYPTPGLPALGTLSRFATQTGARAWIVCEHERGDSPYDQWAWLFAPARPRSAAYELVLAYGGDAGQILWQRDLIGPDPWRVHADEPGGSPASRLVEHLGLRGGGLPGATLGRGRYRKFLLEP